MDLRIRRLGVRVPPSAPRTRRSELFRRGQPDAEGLRCCQHAAKRLDRNQMLVPVAASLPSTPGLAHRKFGVMPGGRDSAESDRTGGYGAGATGRRCGPAARHVARERHLAPVQPGAVARRAPARQGCEEPAPTRSHPSSSLVGNQLGGLPLGRAHLPAASLLALTADLEGALP